jgi:hypothetical protein
MGMSASKGYQTFYRLVAVKAFGDGKALFPTGFVTFFAEYARFRLQNLPHQSKK